MVRKGNLNHYKPRNKKKKFIILGGCIAAVVALFVGILFIVKLYRNSNYLYLPVSYTSYDGNENQKNEIRYTEVRKKQDNTYSLTYYMGTNKSEVKLDENKYVISQKSYVDDNLFSTTNNEYDKHGNVLLYDFRYEDNNFYQTRWFNEYGIIYKEELSGKNVEYSIEYEKNQSGKLKEATALADVDGSQYKYIYEFKNDGTIKSFKHYEDDELVEERTYNTDGSYMEKTYVKDSMTIEVTYNKWGFLTKAKNMDATEESIYYQADYKFDYVKVTK